MLTTHEIIALIFTLTAFASYINYRYLKLPQPIGMTVITVLISLFIIISSYFGLDLQTRVTSILEKIDFSNTILNGMLSYLLFAGALHTNSLELAKYRDIVGTLATVGVILSTIIVGLLMYLVVLLLGIPLPLIYCMLFGALISPTDPIAVLSILKSVKAPRSIEIKITGEALFNDGMGIVVFLMLLSIALGSEEKITLLSATNEFLRQAGGAILLGAVLSRMVASAMCSVENPEVSILMSLALVTGGYALAHSFDFSGPITMVVAGLTIGNKMRAEKTKKNTIVRLDAFWALVDDVLNSILFVLIGLEMLQYDFTFERVILGCAAIVIVLLGRYLSVLVPVKSAKFLRKFSPFVGIMTWGGLRGGVSIALALSMPESLEKQIILPIAYAVVLFSIIGQGLTLKGFVNRNLHRVQ